MDKLAEQKTAIFSKVQKNDQWFKENASMNTSFDVGVRKLLILDREVHVYCAIVHLLLKLQKCSFKLMIMKLNEQS